MSAMRVHERYQSFFPPDVHYVADHAKRAMSEFPLCGGRYYGVDYAARATFDTEARPPMIDAGTQNIPVPTSYMVHGHRRGFLRRLRSRARRPASCTSPTTTSRPAKSSGRGATTNSATRGTATSPTPDGPYIELMAGVFTDNQPDFSFLAPGETRTFSQFWYPIQEIGPAQHANRRAAV